MSTAVLTFSAEKDKQYGSSDLDGKAPVWIGRVRLVQDLPFRLTLPIDPGMRFIVH